MSDGLLNTLDNGVLTLTFNRPAKKNAIDTGMWLSLARSIDEADSNPEVAVILINGAGGNFTAGADIAEFASTSDDVDTTAFETTTRSLFALTKPLICAIDGVAVGGGATLALHADIVLVGENLRMTFPFTRLGLCPELGSSFLLPHIIGARKAADVLMTGDWLGGERCVELGLASHCVASDALQPLAESKAQQLAQLPVSSLVATKALLKEPIKEAFLKHFDHECRQFHSMTGSPENTEALMAMFERRQPNFVQFRK
ncbi:putative enoyl-CoA hydratase echA8 [Sinobacterium norvegicum]|uniref:Enoyl-CoA hydratase echA8 n=1 Tax=Sinobacterium norvegicum TaxID=1641715 RepID=A0ABN8EIS3_9GAMM|nr:enoyl-CoA hydratase-related protein [Sinobacterium norvegicum]CAH0992294.1 putative enoyl-CoA hydratase echA8 [Sinobacterium norvegicum]